MGKTVFCRKWMTTHTWVRECKGDKRSAFCVICRKQFGLGTMGVHALRSHQNGAKHNQESARMSEAEQCLLTPKAEIQHGSEVQKCEDSALPGLFIPAPTDEKQTFASATQGQKQTSFLDFGSKYDVLKSEILWTLKTVCDHSSHRSNESAGPIFKLVFPDSAIATKFTCWEKKPAYLSVFGIAPYFLESMMRRIKGKYTVLFDESLNKKQQMKQMDIHVRYWTEENKVVTSYIGSQFMGHASASQLMEHFQKGVLEFGLDVKMMQQVSMDGPNVNWSFFKMMQKHLADDYDWSLINIGSCGLHTVHNSFKAGVTDSGWEVDKFLSGLYYLVKDAPARKEDFADICTSSLMPLKFVSHRWLENVPVCNRALLILSDVEAFVKAVEKKEKPKPACKLYEYICSAAKDKLFRAKLHFFKFVAGQLQPFLTVFQTDQWFPSLLSN